jgi:hypothetical protein
MRDMTYLSMFCGLNFALIILIVSSISSSVASGTAALMASRVRAPEMDLVSIMSPLKKTVS